jgi:hypothetical protein
MAKLIEGILGGISGTIGTVVGVKGKSGPYIRSMPKKASKKKQVPSPARIAARAKFTYLNTWLKKSTSFFAAGFAVQDPKLTGMQAAFKRNWPAVQGDYPDFSLDFSKIFVSGGDLPQPEHAAVQVIAPNTLEISWTYDSLIPRIFPNDECLLFIYFPEMEESFYNIHCGMRYTGKHVEVLPERFVGKTGEVYLGFRSDDRERGADSMWLGRVVV